MKSTFEESCHENIHLTPKLDCFKESSFNSKNFVIEPPSYEKNDFDDEDMVLDADYTSEESLREDNIGSSEAYCFEESSLRNVDKIVMDSSVLEKVVDKDSTE